MSERDDLAKRMIPDGLIPGKWEMIPGDQYARLRIKEGIGDITPDEQALDGFELPLRYALGLVRKRPDFLSKSPDDPLLWHLIERRQTTDEIDQEIAKRAAQAPISRLLRWILGRRG